MNGRYYLVIFNGEAIDDKFRSLEAAMDYVRGLFDSGKNGTAQIYRYEKEKLAELSNKNSKTN